MSKHFLRFVAVSLLVLSLPAWATEVLVLNATATQVDTGASRSRRGFEIQNLGPNAIYCELSTASTATPTPVLTKSRRVAAGEAWSIGADSSQSVWCKAATADQVTGAATIYTEVR